MKTRSFSERMSAITAALRSRWSTRTSTDDMRIPNVTERHIRAASRTRASSAREGPCGSSGGIIAARKSGTRASQTR